MQTNATALEIIDGKLQITQYPIAVPQAGEVLIRTAYAGVNRADLLQKQGLYAPPSGVGNVPGLEVSGEIVACGEDVGEWNVGDNVCALLEAGGYAEYCIARSTQLLPIPQGMDMAQAAALPEALFTVWSNLYDEAHLAAGETLLMHAGASGIGTIAIQTAAALGATVYATAGTDEKCRICETLGATKAFNYHNEDFVTAIKTATGGKGADVIIDIAGGDYIERNFRAAAIGGRIICLSFLRGAKKEVNFAAMLMKQLTLKGSTLRGRTAVDKSSITLEIKDKLFPLLEDQRIMPVIDSTYTLMEAEKAHERMEQNLNIGKILLKVRAL